MALIRAFDFILYGTIFMRQSLLLMLVIFLFSPFLLAWPAYRVIVYRSEKCVVNAIFHKKTYFHAGNDSQYVYAKITAKGVNSPLSGLDLNNLGLSIDGKLSAGAYVDSVASVMANSYPADHSGRVAVNIYWAFSGRTPVDEKDSKLDIFVLDGKKPVCLFVD